MKKLFKKTKGVKKGVPSGLVISLLVHAVAFFLAGLLVVFSVVKKKEVTFVPPPAIERPKMKLRKPKVKVKKTAKPASPSRIVAKIIKSDMPDLNLPELGGAGSGFGGIGDLGGGFETLPDLSEVTIFGSGQTIGNDFVGTLYDLKRTRRGTPNGLTGINREEILAVLAKFTRGDWKTSTLAKYYQAPKKLYATHFMIPTMVSYIAPTAFGEPDMFGDGWCVLYKGKLVHPVGGKFRFWGAGDDLCFVRINGEILLDGSSGGYRTYLSNYTYSNADSGKYRMGGGGATVGKWFTLEPGVPKDMEVLIGEVPGGFFNATIVVQEEGVEYPRTRQGGPLLPMFKTEEQSHASLDVLYQTLVEGEVSLTNGPIFCDFGTGYSETERQAKAEAALAAAPAPAPESTPVEESPLRLWTTIDGKSVEGEYMITIGDKVMLKTSKGRKIKVLRRNLSPEDREFVDLSNPPAFKIDFRALSKQRLFGAQVEFAGLPLPEALQWRFGARIKKISSGDYNHELNMEYFAIGQQVIDSNKFILLARGKDRFTLNKKNYYTHEFINENAIELVEFAVAGEQTVGCKKKGYLIVVRDKRGVIIAHQSSSNWLWENFDNLEKLPIGAFMDATCARVYPTGPKRSY